MESEPVTRIEDGRLVSEIDGWWEVVTKDLEGNPVVTKAHKHSVKTRPLPEDFSDQFITQAPPKIIRPTRRTKPSRADSTTFVVPDLQIGFRGKETFHDERTMALGQIAIRETMPDQIIFIGDNLDMTPFAKYEQRPDWQQTTQASLDRFSEYLAETRANAPDAKIVVLEGNHEVRFERAIRKYNAELVGLTRARAKDALGVLTLEYLLNLDGLEIDYVSGYPNGEYWLEDNLKAIHGNTIASGSSTAARIVGREVVSTIFGHTHRIEIQHRTIPTRNGGKRIWAASFGTFARVDGGIPSADYTTDSRNQTVLKAKNWQPGAGLVRHNKDKSHPTPIYIENGEMMIEDKRYSL